jgi:hypothetical protein
MQESYISLDPAQADSMTRQVRTRVWNQRRDESCGGEAGKMLAHQTAVTTMLCTFTLMRQRGFRVMPLTPAKLPGLAGLVVAGVLGSNIGSSYATVAMGNNDHWMYLMVNRSAILNGTASFDASSKAE